MAQDPLPSLKRSSSSQSPAREPAVKRQKRHYHHNHKLHQPLQTQLREPALDDGAVTHLLERSIGQVLTSTGYDIAEPTALDAFRQAAEEYILHLASFARQSMTASRRIQPIPHDFEFALGRAFIGTDELLPHIKRSYAEPGKPVPTLLPSPPPEDEDLFDAFDGMPVLSQDLSGEDERKRINYIPSHFPQFPSKHTYRFTPVYTERDTDPRKIREMGMEDSRHGEEALRKLARAAFKDTHATGSGKTEKRLWGRKQESAESMFEKTMRSLTKKSQKSTVPPVEGQPTDAQGEGIAAQQKENDLAPIVNCERDLWRKNTTAKKSEKLPDAKDSAIAKVERWVST